MRVYELAKILKVSNKELLDLLKKLGIIVKSHSSHLNTSEIEKIKNNKTSSTKEVYLDIKLKQDVVKRIPVEDRITTLTENIRYSPFDSQLYYRRGTLYSYLCKYSEALNDYNRSLKIDSQFVKAYYARAELYIAQNNQRLAMRDLEKAIELESSKEKDDLYPVILKEKPANKLLHSLEELENYLLILTKSYIESGNDLLPFLDLIGIDKSDYDLDYLHIESEDLVSVITGIINDRSCCNQLTDFINVSDEQDEFDLWNLFYRFIMKNRLISGKDFG